MKHTLFKSIDRTYAEKYLELFNKMFKSYKCTIIYNELLQLHLVVYETESVSKMFAAKENNAVFQMSLVNECLMAHIKGVLS